MPFVPTRKQLKTLYSLLNQLERENVKLRVIRFHGYDNDKIDNVIEVLCLEDEDRYLIGFDGSMINK